MRYVLRIGLIVAILVAAGLLLMPADWAPRQWLVAASNPSAPATRNLRSAMTSERINAELKTALDTREKYLADSFIELARQENAAIDPALRQRYDSETGGIIGSAQELARGVWDGKCTSFYGFVGAELSNVLSIGDVRDLYTQADNFRNGRPNDPLVIGLATMGIVSIAAIPLHTATSMIKTLAKAQRLSPSFRRELTEALLSGVNTETIAKALPQFSFWDTVPRLGWDGWYPDLNWPLLGKVPEIATALQSGIQLGKLGTFNRLTGNVVTLTKDAGICGTQDALTLVHSSADLDRLTRIAEQRKGAMAALLKLLGRDVLLLPA